VTAPEPTTAWSSRRPAQSALVYLACYLAIALIGGELVAWLAGHTAAPLPWPFGSLTGLVVTLIGAAVLLISLLLVLAICRLSLSAGREALWIIAMTLLFALVRPAVFALLGRWTGHPAAGLRVAAALSAMPGQLLLGNAVLIVWAGFLGRLVSRLIREGKLLFPVAVVAAIADIITVFWGIVAHVSKTAPEVVQTFSAAAPIALPPGVAAPILSAVGIGDFLFLAVFLAIAIRYAMRPAATLWATFAVMLIAPLAYYLYPDATGMPGLPFISAAALWANWRYLRFTGEEKRALAFAGVFVLAAAIGLWAVFHR
jgi:hypothetical protein